MKKAIAILLVLVMSFALIACGGDGDSGTPANSGGTSNAPSSQAPAPSQSSAPAPAAPSSTGDGPVGGVDIHDVNPGGGSIGYVSDDVDHWARAPYHIVYYNYRPTNVAFQVLEAFEQLGEVYNFTVEQLTANGDADVYVNSLQTILIKEPDGLIVDITMELAPRVSEICAEYDIPIVCIFNKAEDVDGVEIIPAVVTDQFYNGRTQMTYLESVYRDYWGDIDRSKITLLIMDWSTNMDIYNRGVGALEKFEELFPGNTHYYGDTAADNLSAEAGTNVSNGILSAHPEVEYWFIVGTVEDITLGTARTVENLGLEDKVLMTASGAAILPGEWDAGYDGVWIANYAVPPFMYAGASLFGLFALIDGRATKDTLWPEHFLPGDKAPRYSINAEMMSRSNYKMYLSDIAAGFGVTLPA